MNRLLKSSLVIAFFIGLGAFASKNQLWRGSVMPIETVKAKWGTTPFNEEAFRAGTEKQRASMAASLIQQKKKYIGKDPADIRKQLGDFDGHYFSEAFPTYLIFSSQKQSEDSWQILFLLSNDQKVSDIVVHKNCCDR